MYSGRSRRQLKGKQNEYIVEILEKHDDRQLTSPTTVVTIRIRKITPAIIIAFGRDEGNGSNCNQGEKTNVMLHYTGNCDCNCIFYLNAYKSLEKCFRIWLKTGTGGPNFGLLYYKNYPQIPVKSYVQL